MSQSAVQTPSLKPQTASNAGVDAWWLGKNSLQRNLKRNQAIRGGQSSSGCAWWRFITEHGQDVQMFIDDQQGQVIIITVVIEGATGQHLRINVSWLFIADHSEYLYHSYCL